jgi:hypothetical protein
MANPKIRPGSGSNPMNAPSPRSRRMVTLACVVVISVACAAPPPEPAHADPAAWSKELERAIGDAACDHDSQCRTIAVGHKACGGPERWVAWSTKVTDEAKLRALFAPRGAADLPPPERPGLRSNCAIVPDPGAVCVDGRCILRTGSLSAR